MLIAERIVPKIVKKMPILKRSVSMIISAVMATFIVSDAINNAFHKQLTSQYFLIEMTMIVGYFLVSGLANRKEIHRKIKFSYYYGVACFTMVFIVLGGMTYFLLPFSKFAN